VLRDEDRIRRNLATVVANDALNARLTRAIPSFPPPTVKMLMSGWLNR
jgi:hypothetical protein